MYKTEILSLLCVCRWMRGWQDISIHCDDNDDDNTTIFAICLTYFVHRRKIRHFEHFSQRTSTTSTHTPKTEQILILKTNILEAHTYRAEWEEEGEKANAYHLTNMNRIQFSIVNINIIIANVVVATSVHHRASTFFHLCTWNCYLPHTHKHTRWANTYGTQPVQTT